MLDVTRTPVARTVTFDLRDLDGTIVEVPTPTERTDARAFVAKVFPAEEIEHLGRPEIVRLDWLRKGWGPSSLFLQTVHWAYARHHALGLRAEVLMYLIVTVVAETVRRHPEDYRDLFAAHPGKADLHVRHDELVRHNPDSPWDEAIVAFDKALRPYVPSRIMNQILPEFTSASEESRIVSLIAFMDTASPYYDYHTHTLCGIPRVVLLGEAADYRRLATAANELARSFHKHLAVYFANLQPVLETIATTAETGKADVEFWGQIYKHFDASGTSRFAGWISCFLWYVHKQDPRTETSTLVVKDARLADWRAVDARGGLDSGAEPTHLSSVPFTWHASRKTYPMRFIGGVLGLDCVEGALTPALSYGVLRAA